MSLSLVVIILIIAVLVRIAFKKLSPSRMREKFTANMGDFVEQAKRTPISDQTSTPTNTKTPSGMYQWEDDNNFQFQVVGESFYQENISRIASGFTDGESRICMAILELEDHNQYDNKAVAVYLQGLKVGHLSRGDARSFRRRLGRKGLTGQTTCTKAVIVGGGLTNGGESKSFGVYLDMKEFNN